MNHTAANPQDAQSLHLKSICNARELGGYATQDGKTVKKGVLLRTASLTNISAEEKQLLTDTFNVSAIVDLRASFETEKNPEPVFDGVRQYNLLVLDENLLSERTGSLRSIMTDRSLSLAQRMILIHEAGIICDQMYVEFLALEHGKKCYREFMQILLDTPEGHAVLWHCTSGKDRTGVAAMLILGALNVSEQTIMDDYMLTNDFFAEEISALRQQLEKDIQDPEQLDELLVAGRGVHSRYMQNALDYIHTHYGDIPGYLKTALGLTDEDLLRLNALYTE